MVTGKTSSGFVFCIPKRRFQNMLLVDALAEMETNALAMVRVISLILGEDGKGKLYDHLREEDGIVDMGKAEKEMMEILEAFGKNS